MSLSAALENMGQIYPHHFSVLVFFLSPTLFLSYLLRVQPYQVCGHWRVLKEALFLFYFKYMRA